MLHKFIFGTDNTDYALGKGWALQLQLCCDEPIYSIFELFSSEIGVQKTKELFGKPLKDSLSLGALSHVKNTWRHIVEGTATDSQSLISSNDPQGYVELFFRYALSDPTKIPVYSQSRSVDSSLEDYHLDPNAIRLCLQKLYEIEPEWRDLIGLHIQSEGALRTVLRAESECSWIYRAALSGYIEIIDPYSGGVVRSRDGLIAYGRGIYRFESLTKNSFFLITGGPWNAAAGIYLPKDNIAIIFGRSGNSFFTGKSFANLLTAYFRKRAEKHKQAEYSRHSLCSTESRNVAIYVPPTDNFAHHIWNYNSFLYRALSLNSIKNIESIIYSGSEFFGPLPKIHNSLETQKWLRPRRQNVVDSKDIAGSPLVIQAGGYFMHPGLIESCIRVASSTPKFMDGCIDPDDVVDQGAKLVVWFAIRTRGRAWADQAESIAKVINSVSEAHENILFVLDGFSRPLGIDNISNKWVGTLQALGSVASEIKAKCGPNVISLIDNSFRESLLWASRCNLYVAPYGSSQHKVGWFSKAKGLVYVPNTVQDRQVQNSAGLCASPISSRPDIVYCEPAGVASLAHGPKRSFAVSNYDVSLSPEAVVTWLNQRISAIRETLENPSLPRDNGTVIAGQD